MNFDKALESIKTVKLTGGIFGKTTLLLIVLSVCITAICINADTWWFPLVFIPPLMLIITFALKRCLDFAESNPQAAIMEGAELLSHERMLHATKEEGTLIPTNPTTDHSVSALPEAEIELPDPLPRQTISHGHRESNGENGDG